MSAFIRAAREAVWIADAHCGDGEHFVVHADEKLTAFVELESAIRGSPSFTHPCTASDTVQAQKRTTKVSSTYNANSAIIKTDLNQPEDILTRLTSGKNFHDVFL